MAPRWTTAEEEMLQELWGERSIVSICRSLKRRFLVTRTYHSVIQRAVLLKLGPALKSSDKLSASALAEVIGVSDRTVVYWIQSNGLRARRKALSKPSKYAPYMIDIADFWEWAETHQNRIDSRQIEPLILGAEPAWMAEKRIRDIGRSCRYAYWEREEEAKLKNLFKLGYSCREIGARLGRSAGSVSDHLQVFDVWGKEVAK